MPVLEPADRPYGHVAHVGLAIQQTSLGYHSGFLYKLADSEPRVLHLAFHHLLKDEVITSDYRWAQLGLDDDNLAVLSELLARIAGKEPRIPYGFNSEGIAIDPVTGGVLPAPVGHGLTCATFMVATLKAYGHDLLEADAWPTRDDDAKWEAAILHALSRFASPEHVQAVRENPRSARLRPAEVVGSGTKSSDDWPVAYTVARDLADQVQADLA